MIIALLQAQGCDIVSRQHPCRKTDFRRGQRLGKDDHIVIWRKPARPDWLDQVQYEKLPATLQIRELRIGRLIVVTTLSDAARYTKESLVALYQTRWHCELDLRAIKQIMGMDVLRCQTPDMVEKEIAVHVLAYNLIQALMQKAAQHAQQPPRTVKLHGDRAIAHEPSHAAVVQRHSGRASASDLDDSGRPARRRSPWALRTTRHQASTQCTTLAHPTPTAGSP